MSEALGGSRRRRPANELPTSATYRESQPLYARTAQAKDAERQRQRDNKCVEARPCSSNARWFDGRAAAHDAAPSSRSTSSAGERADCTHMWHTAMALVVVSPLPRRRMARALDEIKREPPKVFHAPMSYDSLKHGGQVKSARDGKASDPQPCTEVRAGLRCRAAMCMRPRSTPLMPRAPSTCAPGGAAPRGRGALAPSRQRVGAHHARPAPARD